MELKFNYEAQITISIGNYILQTHAFMCGGERECSREMKRNSCYEIELSEYLCVQLYEISELHYCFKHVLALLLLFNRLRREFRAESSTQKRGKKNKEHRP
jgi:hypothetical protein